MFDAKKIILFLIYVLLYLKYYSEVFFQIVFGLKCTEWEISFNGHFHIKSNPVAAKGLSLRNMLLWEHKFWSVEGMLRAC